MRNKKRVEYLESKLCTPEDYTTPEITIDVVNMDGSIKETLTINKDGKLCEQK